MRGEEGGWGREARFPIALTPVPRFPGPLSLAHPLPRSLAPVPPSPCARPNRAEEYDLHACADLDPSGPDTDDEPWEDSRTVLAADVPSLPARSTGGLNARGGYYAVDGPGAYEPDAALWRRLRSWHEVDGLQPERAFHESAADARGDAKPLVGADSDAAYEVDSGSSGRELDSDDDEAPSPRPAGAAAKRGSELRAGGRAGTGSESERPPASRVLSSTSLSLSRRAHNSESDEDDEPVRAPTSAALPASTSSGGLSSLFRPSSAAGRAGPAAFKAPSLSLGRGFSVGGKASSAPVEVPQPTEAELRAAFVLCEATLRRRQQATVRRREADGGAAGGGTTDGGKDVSVFKSDDGGFRCVNGRGEAVRVYCGIIDILQQYTKFKQMEHAYKAARWFSEKDVRASARCARRETASRARDRVCARRGARGRVHLHRHFPALSARACLSPSLSLSLSLPLLPALSVQGISVVSPDKYALRFRTFILGKFAPLTPPTSAALLQTMPAALRGGGGHGGDGAALVRRTTANSADLVATVEAAKARLAREAEATSAAAAANGHQPARSKSEPTPAHAHAANGADRGHADDDDDARAPRDAHVSRSRADSSVSHVSTGSQGEIDERGQKVLRGSAAVRWAHSRP